MKAVKFFTISFLALSMAFFVFLSASTASAADERDPLIEILIEKGVLTEEEAKQIEAEVVKRKAAKEAPAAEKQAPGAPALPFDFSGQYRARTDLRNNSDFNKGADDKVGSTNQRIRINFNGLKREGRWFLQVQDARFWGNEMTTSGNTSADNIDLHQGYIELGKHFTARVGKQEIAILNQRLVGASNWGNNGRSFDGVRLTYPFAQSNLDAFAVKLSDTATNSTTTATSDSNLWGLVYNWTGDKVWKPSLYFFHKDLAAEVWALGNVTMADFGNGWALDWEVALEGGTAAAGKDMDALGCHLGVKFTDRVTKKWWVGAEYNFASGDGNAADNKTQTFDQFYPSTHDKFGYMDYIGWKNIKNFRLNVGAKPEDNLTLQLDYHTFRLDEAKDSMYGTAGTAALTDAIGASGADIGSEIDLTANYAIAKGLGLQMGYSKFLTGSFIDGVRGAVSGDSDWGYLQLIKDF